MKIKEMIEQLSKIKDKEMQIVMGSPEKIYKRIRISCVKDAGEFKDGVLTEWCNESDEKKVKVLVLQ